MKTLTKKQDKSMYKLILLLLLLTFSGCSTKNYKLSPSTNQIHPYSLEYIELKYSQKYSKEMN